MNRLLAVLFGAALLLLLSPLPGEASVYFQGVEEREKVIKEEKGGPTQKIPNGVFIHSLNPTQEFFYEYDWENTTEVYTRTRLCRHSNQ